MRDPLNHRNFEYLSKDVLLTGMLPGAAIRGITLAKVEVIGSNFARSKGIDPAASDALDKLRALTAEEVIDGLNMGYRPSGPPTNSGPFIDGRVVVDVARTYADGQFARVLMVIGTTSAGIGGKSGFTAAGVCNASATIADKGVPVWYYRFFYVAQSVASARRAARQRDPVLLRQHGDEIWRQDHATRCRDGTDHQYLHR
jgi:hypothetical protein